MEPLCSPDRRQGADNAVPWYVGDTLIEQAAKAITQRINEAAHHVSLSAERLARHQKDPADTEFLNGLHYRCDAWGAEQHTVLGEKVITTGLDHVFTISSVRTTDRSLSYQA